MSRAWEKLAQLKSKHGVSNIDELPWKARQELSKLSLRSMSEKQRKCFKREHAIRNLGQKMLDEHCSGWRFGIENLNNGNYGHADRAELAGHGLSIGGTNFATRTVSVDFRMLTELRAESEIRETILHEIAHVLAGKKAKPHGRRWLRIAREIGVSDGNLIKNLIFNAQCDRLRRETAAQKV
jgi:hypothetical protein